MNGSERRQRHRQLAREYQQRYYHLVLWRNAKAHAQQKGIRFSIKREDVVVPDRCPVLNIKLRKKLRGPRKDNTPSLDRIDNKKGYVRGNVRVISWKANWLKGSMSLDQARRIVAYMEYKV